ISGDNGSEDLPEPMAALAPESPAVGAAEEEEAVPAFSLDDVRPSTDTVIPASEPATEIDIAQPQRQLGFEVSDTTPISATVEPVVEVASVTQPPHAPSAPVVPAVETTTTTAAEPRRAANDPR